MGLGKRLDGVWGRDEWCAWVEGRGEGRRGRRGHGLKWGKGLKWEKRDE